MVLLHIIFSFDNIFQNAFKCDMVSTTCSKMPSNATWFRQHVPKCSQMRHGFDNMFQTYQTYQPTNLPNLHLYLYLFLVHAQHSCACTTLLCMHWRGQGPRPGPNKKTPPRAGPTALFCWVPALVPGPSSACTRVLCMYKIVVHAQESFACTRILCMHNILFYSYIIINIALIHFHTGLRIFSCIYTYTAD